MSGTIKRRALTATVSALALATGLVAATSTAAAQTPNTPFAGIPGHAANGTNGFDANPDMNAPGFLVEHKIETGGTNNFNCYRIPALITAKDGTLLASYDGRPDNCADAPQANSIVQRISRDNGATWEELKDVAPGKPTPVAEKIGYSDPSYITDRETGEIFNFHVKSFDTAIVGGNPSQVGNDPNNRKVIQAAYAKSSDNGATWSYDHVITREITPDLSWKARFATSGNGIQLTYGKYKGRLIQPAMLITTSNQWKAVAWISDDHGKTWFPSNPWGQSMDENKIVELSDGTLMNNSRSSNRGETFRKISYSYDGGMNWTEPVLDYRLPDPRNNASIIRAFPNAPEGSALAKVLLFSNTASTSGRTNGTIRMSCDDGKTWPVEKLFKQSDLQYTHMTTLANGDIGLLTEGHNRGNMNDIYFVRFNLAWLGESCLGTAAAPALVAAGESVEVPVTITNTTGAAIVDQPLEVSGPEGWVVGPTPRLTLAAGESKTVAVNFTAPATAVNGPNDFRLGVAHGAVDAVGRVTITVHGGVDHGGAPEVTEPTVFVTVANPKPTYQVGERIYYRFTVVNPLNNSISVIPSGGSGLESFDPAKGSPNCRWNSFNARHTAACTSAFHTVTEEDIARGEFVTETSWALTIARGQTRNQTLSTPVVRFGEVPAPAAPARVSASIDAIGTVASTGEALNVPVKVRVQSTTESVPADTKVDLYLDGLKVASALTPVEGVVDATVEVDSVAIGAQPVSHSLVARPVTAAENTRRIDGTATFVVSPQDRLRGTSTLTLAELADAVVEPGKNVQVLVSAKLQREGKPVAGERITFTSGDARSDAVTNSEGVALAYLKIAQLGEDLTEATTVTVTANAPEAATATTDFDASEATQTFKALPQPKQEEPEQQPKEEQPKEEKPTEEQPTEQPQPPATSTPQDPEDTPDPSVPSFAQAFKDLWKALVKFLNSIGAAFAQAMQGLFTPKA
ncbi:exo-alpha-sialidase [Corynebacterium felinum]|uniref:exo-alpha-sialidase n=1 Tax=Corynebacterium felinum TaxID=131318 RepID=A0ABU2B4V5_9CORY|nr:exo-alpha-sialidase [Corynebacterium felinum]MDF5820590.1 exo-alpha-sialidase [Corynebacterium felinum]MDR7353641.1 sialidase-1 [Corynebacterium felinum]WJY95820.1 Sialidase precursor [Corynebacterium felinum]